MKMNLANINFKELRTKNTRVRVLEELCKVDDAETSAKANQERMALISELRPCEPLFKMSLSQLIAHIEDFLVYQNICEGVRIETTALEVASTESEWNGKAQYFHTIPVKYTLFMENPREDIVKPFFTLTTNNFNLITNFEDASQNIREIQQGAKTEEKMANIKIDLMCNPDLKIDTYQGISTDLNMSGVDCGNMLWNAVVNNAKSQLRDQWAKNEEQIVALQAENKAIQDSMLSMEF